MLFYLVGCYIYRFIASILLGSQGFIAVYEKDDIYACLLDIKILNKIDSNLEPRGIQYFFFVPILDIVYFLFPQHDSSNFFLNLDIFSHLSEYTNNNFPLMIQIR